MTDSKAASDVVTSIVTTVPEFDRLRDDWLGLLDASASVNVHHDPDVIRLALTDPLNPVRPHFLVVRAPNGSLLGIAPFYREDTQVRLRLSVIQVGSLRARALRLFGDSFILAGGQDPQVVLTTVFQVLHRDRRDFDLLWIYTQRLADPLWPFLSSPAARRFPFRPVVTSALPDRLHRLTFDRTLDDYLAEARSKPGYPGKTIRRFWRDGKDRCAIIRISRPQDVGRFLDAVDRVYNNSWQARTYGSRSRRTASDLARLEAMAGLGYLRSYLLAEDNTPIAFVLGFQYRGHYAYEETAYDSGRSVVSPGSVLTHAVIEDLFKSDTPRELDFGFGDGGYKRIFGTAVEDVCSLYILHSRRWRVLLGLQQALNAVDAAARAMITRAGLAARVRRLLKRQR